MVVKAEQERFKTLIADTVSCLCKNGLQYTKEFCIEGLLGITLDRDKVFLVNFKELVRSETQQESDSKQSGVKDNVPFKSAKRKRRRSQSKSRDWVHKDESITDTNALFDQSGSVDNSSESRAKETSIKEERPEEPNDEDLVFIKEEAGQDISSYSASGDQSYSGAPSNTILEDLLQQEPLYATPTSVGSLAAGWNLSQATAAAAEFSQQSKSSQPNSPNTSDEQQTASFAKLIRYVPADFLVRRNGMYECRQCNHNSGNSCRMREHMTSRHTGINYFECLVCNSTFPTYKQATKHIKSEHPPE